MPIQIISEKKIIDSKKKEKKIEYQSIEWVSIKYAECFPDPWSSSPLAGLPNRYSKWITRKGREAIHKIGKNEGARQNGPPSIFCFVKNKIVSYRRGNSGPSCPAVHIYSYIKTSTTVRRCVRDFARSCCGPQDRRLSVARGKWPVFITRGHNGRARERCLWSSYIASKCT